MNHNNNFQKNQGLVATLVAAFRTNPANGFYLWVAMWPVLALIGVILLKLPMSSTGDIEISMVDAIFTSISAVTLTGLTVVDTNLVWSTAGLLILLGLFQLGGLGAFAGLAALLLRIGQLTGLRENQIRRAQGLSSDQDESRLSLLWIVKFMLGMQLIAFLLIFISFSISEGRVHVSAMWPSVFLAISAVNSAGFVYWGEIDSVTGNNFLMAIFSFFTVIGSFGLLVLHNLVGSYREVFIMQLGTAKNIKSYILSLRAQALREIWRRLSLDAKIVFSTSFLLLTMGTVWVFVREYIGDGVLSDRGLFDALFHSLTESSFTRSSGFSTIDWSAPDTGTLLVVTALMFIGGASGSVGGGIRLTTFGLVAHKFISVIRGDQQQAIFGRGITDHDFRIALTFLSCSLIFLMTMVLLISQVTTANLENVIFETASAFSKTGFSTGLTGELGDFGKILLAITMLVGRIGPLAVLTLLAGDPDRQQNAGTIRYPEESVVLG
ncbi:MAG: potassium transporter TrkG [Dehalococcoidia bacterium]|jgi:Trk-type K+ transport system membrane component|nr:potassium transporter TrkG [Dehalococcoidia bacterium]